MTEHERRLLRQSVRCELRLDDTTRQLYATDASIYQLLPAGVAFPRSTDEVVEVVRAARETGVSVSPRGAGTGLAGGALGEGLVVDLARHDRSISELDLERGTVRVGPGVVLDQLNEFLRPHGLWFGPDVATSSRATLGGMVANNSSGAHVPVYGTTVEHVTRLKVVLADGTVAEVGAGVDGLPDQRAEANRIVEAHAAEIRSRLHQRIRKRWPGYGLDRYLREPSDLTRLLAGSEGTLAAVVAAELRVVPLPGRRALGVLFFPTVGEAMAAAAELLDLEAAAIEHIDRLLFDQTRGQLAFRAARALLELDDRPCESILIVEFFDDADDKLAALEERRIGERQLIVRDPLEQQLVWDVRKHGLSLLTACPGPAKPTPGIEDVCVPPETLPSYVKSLQEILRPLALEASFYGHAASGELHVRPKLDLHTADDLAKFRHVADEVARLTLEFQGSLAAEHGVGIARTEYLPAHLGPELMDATREVKRLFDPGGVFNPGKIIGDGRFRIDAGLRQGAGSAIPVPFEPAFGYVDRDGSFTANLEQCNGNGACRKDPPTMCPTFRATGEEIHSTRGRANAIRAALEGGLGGGAPLLASGLDAALSSCLSCKACKSECPSNVDLALLKADLLNARHKSHGVPLADRLIAAADRLGRWGSATAVLTNAVVSTSFVRSLARRFLGIAPDSPLPPFARVRFDRWFRRRAPRGSGSRGSVLLWDDTWVRYHEPHIGEAAVQVLEHAGYQVRLVVGRRCCGRPAASRGLLERAIELGRHNLEILTREGSRDPIVFLEPSCYSMFLDEYRELRLPGADDVAARAVLFDDFVLRLLEEDTRALGLPLASGADRRSRPPRVVIHPHCHARALRGLESAVHLAKRIPVRSVEVIDSGCCGMAGAFGIMKKTRELSLAVSRPLVEAVRSQPPGTIVVASGTSCRHQIADRTEAKPVHMAELLLELLEAGGSVAIS